MDTENGSPLGRIKHEYSKHLQLRRDDELVIDYYYSLLAAVMHQGLSEPVWGWIIAPPSSGKTEVLKPTEDYDGCIFVSSMTENSLLSGFSENGEDPSLVLQLNGRLLTIKDFTAIMDMGMGVISKLMGDLRDCFDGSCSKASGKVGLRKYKSRFGVCAAVTDRIDVFCNQYQQLGERFLSFRMNRIPPTHDERLALLVHIQASMKGKDYWQAQLKEVVCTELDKVKKLCLNTVLPVIPDDASEVLRILADLLSLFRTSAVGGTAVQPELGFRVLQQMMNLGLAHAVACGRTEWVEEDTLLVKRVFIDTLPVVRRRILMAMSSRGKHRPAMGAVQLATLCRTTKEEIVKVMVQYAHSGVVEQSGRQANEPTYRLLPSIYATIIDYAVFGGGV